MTDLEKSIREIPDLLKAIRNKFFAEKFGEIKTDDGKTLSYEGDTPQAGAAIFIIEGDQKTPAPDGEYVTEAGVITVKEGKITDVKMEEQTGTSFIDYLKSDAYQGENYDFEKYPWDQCIEDQKAAGVHSPECVCAAIKNRTVKQMMDDGFVDTVEKAITEIQNAFKGKAVFAHLFRKLFDIQPANISVEMKKEQKDTRDSFDNEMKGLKARIFQMENQMKVVKELFDIIERLTKAPSFQSNFKRADGGPKVKDNDLVLTELDTWRKKYTVN